MKTVWRRHGFILRVPVQVSIRAPELSPGRPSITSTASAVWLFQSAPRSYPRGDVLRRVGSLVSVCFNPRPGAIPGATAGKRPVSRAGACFNPRPGAIPGATQPSGLGRGWGSCFNPRPGAIPGATPRMRSSARPPKSFNPRPGAIPGATQSRKVVRADFRVSIRAPELSPGRPDAFWKTVALSVFQSAPRSYPRGDILQTCGKSSMTMFQSAPRSYPRGDVPLFRKTK